MMGGAPTVVLGPGPSHARGAGSRLQAARGLRRAVEPGHKLVGLVLLLREQAQKLSLDHTLFFVCR